MTFHIFPIDTAAAVMLASRSLFNVINCSKKGLKLQGNSTRFLLASLTCYFSLISEHSLFGWYIRKIKMVSIIEIEVGEGCWCSCLVLVVNRLIAHYISELKGWLLCCVRHCMTPCVLYVLLIT